MNCNPCEGTGFQNIEQVPPEIHADAILAGDFHTAILGWMATTAEPHDVEVCDCCGDGETWYGTPGEHHDSDFDGVRWPPNGGVPGCA